MNEEFKEELKEGIEESLRTGEPQEIPVYQRFKGKSAHGQKSWKITKRESKTIETIGYVLFVVQFVGLAIQITKLPMWIKVLFIILMVIGWVTLAATMLIILFKYNKKDPVEMHYYKEDYKHNYITGEGYDNSKEITKEEFFGKDE